MQNYQHKGWLLIIALGLLFVAVGAIIDFFLKKHEVKKLHDIFLRWANALSDISLKHWQIKIANSGFTFLTSLHKNCIVFIEKPMKIFSKTGDVSIAVVLTLLYLFAFIGLYILLNSWVFAILSLPYTGLILLMGFGYWIDVIFKKLFKFEFFTAELFFTLFSVFFISSLLSLIANVISIGLIPASFTSSHWYSLSHGMIYPTHPILMSIVNFPFDLVTILVSLALLRYVVRSKKFIGFIAIIDIVISALLTIMLYTFLILIENNWTFSNLQIYIRESIKWFSQILSVLFNLKPTYLVTKLGTLKDIHLLPILLTTFVPVVIYMSIFVFLSFAKPIMWVSARFFSVVGEREDSVFKQFGFLLASLMAVAKAIYYFLSAP